MDETAFKVHKSRADKAWSKRNTWQKVLSDVYDFVAPYRASNLYSTKDPSQLAVKIFDPTAMDGLKTFAGKLYSDLLQPPFFALDLGPAKTLSGEDMQVERDKLEAISEAATSVFLTGEWEMAAQEMALDLGISTGFMQILKGTTARPVRFITVSQDEVALDLGPYGEVNGIFFKRKWTYRAISEVYKPDRFDDDLKTKIKASPEEDVVLHQDTIWIAKDERWQICVYLDGAQAIIHTETCRKCPWLTPRYLRMPNSEYGIGPAILSLPTNKTLNKTLEFILKHAAIDIAGIYTRINDGVFNPDTARIEPGAMWAVARNGGVLGPSVARLPTGGGFDVSQIILNDLRTQVSRAMHDQHLPPDGQSPRSAAEIIERVKRLAQDHVGAFGRLVYEIIIPAVERVLEILLDWGALPQQITIDQLSVKIRITSPLAQSIAAAKAGRVVEFAQIGGALAPQSLGNVLKVDQALEEVARDMGVPNHLLMSIDDKKQIAINVEQQVAEKMAAIMEQMKQQKQADAPPNGDPAQGELIAA